MIIKAIFRFMATVITLFVVNHEFHELFESSLFLLGLLTWGFYGLLVFWIDFSEAKNPSLGDKIDNLNEKFELLLTEIQGLRKDLTEGKNDRNTNDNN